MFDLLSRVLLWLLVGTVVFTFFQRFYPEGSFVGRLFLVFLLIIVLLSFVNPNQPGIAPLWSAVSFPLKPLGGSILLMIAAAQRMKGGGIDKPGGFYLGWALTILLLASTPAVAYLLGRSPIADVPIAGRGLGLEDFVPSAQALARTTQEWETYLARIYSYLRGSPLG